MKKQYTLVTMFVCMLFSSIAIGQNMKEKQTRVAQTGAIYESSTFTTNKSQGGATVLIAAADDPGFIMDVESKIQANSFYSVDTFDAANNTPTLALLNTYEVVFIWSNFTYDEPTGFGNVLAQYVEAGGRVLDATFSNSVAIAGDFNQYKLFENAQTSVSSPNITIDDVFVPNHPVLDGIVNFNIGSGAFHEINGTVTAGSVVLAEYTDNSPFAIIKENVGPSNVRRAYLNFFPPSSDALGSGWDASSQGADLMVNAIDWLLGVTGTNNPPVAVCQNIMVALDENGAATITAADVDGGSTDSDGTIESLVIDNDSFTCSDLGENTVTLIVTDNDFGTSTCTATVTVIDVTAPVIDCSSDITMDIEVGTCGAVVTFDAPTAVDSCEQAGALNEVLDNFNANSATITANIPFPYNFVMDGAGGVNSTQIGDGTNDLYDGGNRIDTNISAGTNISYSDNLVIPSTSFGANGEYFTRKVPNMWMLAADLDAVDTFSISGNLGADGGGTADGFTSTITVDGMAYNILVKRVHGSNDPSVNHLIIIPENSAITQSFSTNTDNDQHDIAGLSATTRMYYLLFFSENGGISIFIDDATMETIATSFIEQTVNITPTEVVQTAGPASGSTFPVGTTEIVYTATDASGNTSTCSFDVVVEDNIAPTVSCPADETVVINEGDVFVVPDYIADGTASAADNCNFTTSQVPVAGTQLSEGTYTITISAEDESGTIATCTSMLTVDEVLGTNDQAITNFTLFPNPATTQITVRGNFELDNVIVYNTLGQKVLTSTAETLNIQDLSSGMFLVQITDNEGNKATKRFIKK